MSCICNGECWSRGPRIGGAGVPLCILPDGHLGRHMAHESWSRNPITWGSPDNKVSCDCKRAKEKAQ